jgi:hypothetical protein
MDRRRTFKDFFDMKTNERCGPKSNGNKRESAQRAFGNLDTNKAKACYY